MKMNDLLTLLPPRQELERAFVSKEDFEAADAALYRAKTEGRDRAVVAERSVEHAPLATLPPGRL